MKKFARLSALVLVIVMLFSFVGCGSLEDKIAGEWEGKMEAEGISADITLTFDDEEKEVTTKVSVMGMSNENTVDYEVDDDKLIIDDEEVEYEFDGDDKLVIKDDSGAKMELERVE